jgi:hypothetical protein
MTPEEALEHRHLLMAMGLLREETADHPWYFVPSNALQLTHDVHAPIDTEAGRPLPCLATQWRKEWERRCQASSTRMS